MKTQKCYGSLTRRLTDIKRASLYLSNTDAANFLFTCWNILICEEQNKGVICDRSSDVQMPIGTNKVDHTRSFEDIKTGKVIFFSLISAAVGHNRS